MSRVPRPKGRPKRLRRTTWPEYLIRFGFGGLITALVGLAGKAFGPAVAGLFLAFPAILPASLTLVAEHEDEEAAGHTALGAAGGSIGLAVFGLVIWTLAPSANAAITLTCALVAWLLASLLGWISLKTAFPGRKTG